MSRHHRSLIDVEQQLRQQVQKIQSSLPQSAERRLLLHRLLQDILHSGKLGHPQKAVWPDALYADLYAEALQKTLLVVCQKIDHYRSEHPVMAWVNFQLKCQLNEVIQDYLKKGMTQVPKTGETVPVICLPTWDDLDRAPHADAEDSDIVLLQQFLQQDPERLLQKKQLRERADVTFQSLALAKFVEGRSWAEIAITLEVSPQTLCSFFNRQLKELLPYFRKYLKY
ncbi:MAG: hypothetical protein MUF72_23325 [Elainella sp. Prado103]|jgi:DNA-directed RNA polymerase specialized sigma24 family protein|nr:hypothetical protein [Elainella sp. Prado103]